MSAATRNPSAPHITLPEGLPGIRGPMAFRPETAKPLNELADVLLRGPHTLTQAERELIATYVSAQNECRYCQTIHGAIAAHHLRGNEDLVREGQDRSGTGRLTTPTSIASARPSSRGTDTPLPPFQGPS